MDEILALQEELRKLQEQSSMHRLSERNCVELIMRLVKLGKLTVYFTQDGKEYVTPEQLENEIRDELMQHGGKIGVLYLPTLLNIDLNHIEARLAEMLKRDRRLQIMNGEIMTKYYLDGVAQEINEALAESGQIILTELAPRFSLTTDFVIQIVQERLGRTIKGQLEQGTLYTHLFIDRCKAQMRAAFSAITRPTPISHIVSAHSFNERLFYASLDEIKNEPRFAGVIDRGTYVPHIYSYTRRKWIESFLSQNGFIEYNKLSKISIPEPRKYLQANFEGLPLETCFVADSVIQQVDASVDHALANNAWLDVMTLVEFQLSAKDAMVLLKACPSFIAASQEKKESPVILDDHYLVSRGLLERCVASLKDKVATETPKKAPLIIQALGKHVPASKPVADEEEEGKGKGRGGKGGGKGNKGGGGGGGKGGRGGNQKGNKRRGKGRGDDDSDEEEEEEKVERPSARGRNAAAAAAAASKARTSGAQLEVLTEAEVRACLKQWYEEAEGDFLDVLYQQVRPIVRELNKAAVENIQQNASSGKKKDHKALEQQFGVLHQNIQLFFRSAEEVTDSSISEALRRHLLATLCTEATNLLVYMMALHHGVSMEAEKITTANERKEVIAQLPLTAATPLTALADSLRGSGVEEFLTQLESLSEEAQLHLKPLDKKKQRLLTHTHKLDFLEQLKEAAEPPLVFHLSAVVLYAQVFNLALHIPGRSVPALLTQMADHLPGDLMADLTEFSELQKKGEAIDAERVEGLKSKVIEFASSKKSSS